MTEAEALEILKRDDDDMRKGYFCLNDFTALEVAKNALEKQIVKPIIRVKKPRYESPYRCSLCEADQIPTEFFNADGSESKEKHTFCWKCGQKLDWSEV